MITKKEVLIIKILFYNDIHYTESRKFDRKADNITFRDYAINELIKHINKVAEEENVDLIVNNGDVIHDTSKINMNEISNILNIFHSTTQKDTVIISGNHDINHYENEYGSFISMFNNPYITKVITSPLIQKYDDVILAFVPYYKARTMVEKLEELYKYLKGSKKPIIMFGHFGFDFALPIFNPEQEDIVEYDKVKDFMSIYTKVFLGHLHFKYSKDNIEFTSTVTTHNFTDSFNFNTKVYNNDIGFSILNTDTMTTNFYSTIDYLPVFMEVDLDSTNIEDLSDYISSKQIKDVVEYLSNNKVYNSYFYLRLNTNNKHIDTQIYNSLKLDNILSISIKTNQESINKNYVKQQLNNIDKIDNVVDFFINQGLNEFDNKEKALEVITKIKEAI